MAMFVYRERLLRGESISFRPRGNSMLPRIRSGELVTVRPLHTDEPRIDAVVLVRVRGRDILHRIGAIDGERYQITNQRGHVNGWVRRSAIYGIVATP